MIIYGLTVNAGGSVLVRQGVEIAAFKWPWYFFQKQHYNRVKKFFI